jgi:GNAT superfamily N-acetyltransferase
MSTTTEITVPTTPASPGRHAPSEGRPLPAGFELDDDRGRVDVDAVHAFLSTEAYWALGRSREAVERSIREATRVVGLYRDGGQAGFARVVSDGIAFAFLNDVYVLPEAQGMGLGAAIVREAVEGSQQRGLRWLLHTADAQGLYRKFGFAEPSATLMERPAQEGGS